MPVSQLLCEGHANSPDVRVLGKLLAGLCEVKPLGGKYGMGTKIIARREILGESSVFGILDGDFLKVWQAPDNRPFEWESGDKSIHFGWRWERKEIENYLIDPIVVGKVLGAGGPDMADYRAALEGVRDTVAVYQAARIALSANRIRFNDLASAFGRKRGRERHPFPDALDAESCRDGIEQAVEEHRATQLVDVADVHASSNVYLPECQTGSRHKQYLHAFAGKDLFWGMNQWCRDHGFDGAWVFREKILTGIQRTSEDIADWLPEWKSLRETIAGI